MNVTEIKVLAKQVYGILQAQHEKVENKLQKKRR